MIRSAETALRLSPTIDALQMSVLRIGATNADDDGHADILVEGDLSEHDVETVSDVVRIGLYRAVITSLSISPCALDLIVERLKTEGARIGLVKRLPRRAGDLSPPIRIARGEMTDAVGSICQVLATYRTLWRCDGYASVLERPVSADPWLRRLDVSEVEALADALTAGTADDHGKDGFLLSRVAQAVLARLPTLLPPASGAEWADGEHAPGYDPDSEIIYLHLQSYG